MEPRPRGGLRHGKLKQHREFILGAVERQPDITMPELAAKLLASKGVKIDPSNMSKFLIAQGFSVKKILRAAEQDSPDLARARTKWKDTRQPLMGQHRDHLRAVAARIMDDSWKAIGSICAFFAPEECSKYFAATGY